MSPTGAELDCWVTNHRFRKENFGSVTSLYLLQTKIEVLKSLAVLKMKKES